MKDKNDMTQGSPGKVLILFAIPMVMGNLFQQLYNIVDSMIVGNFVGSDALAAVGASTSVVFLFVAIATGLSMGCSVIISQLFGAKKILAMKTAISTTLISIGGFSIILTILGLLLNKAILQLMKTPENIMQDASDYLAIYFMGLVFLFFYNGLIAVFNGMGKSQIPLYFLILSSIINVVLDLVFVLRFDMGVAGVAWATLIAQGVSAVASFLCLLVVLRKMPTEEKPDFFSASILARMLKIAVPSSLQQSIVSIGFLFVQRLINGYGPMVIAGYTAATKIDNIAIMPMINVGNAVSTFTAQNMGAQKIERVKKGYRAGMAMSVVISLTVTGILYLWGSDLVGAFVDSKTGSGVIGVGVEYLQVVSIFYVVMGIMNISNGILRGSGDVKVFMLSTLCNFTIRVIMAYALVKTPLGASGIWWAIPIGWTVGLVIALVRYLSGKWKHITLV